MRISTNSIGNYAPARMRDVSHAKSAEKTSIQNSKKDISNKEKQFFANMYPENKSEIMDYHFYQKSGKMSGVKLGSLIDRRG